MVSQVVDKIVERGRKHRTKDKMKNRVRDTFVLLGDGRNTAGMGRIKGVEGRRVSELMKGVGCGRSGTGEKQIKSGL